MRVARASRISSTVPGPVSSSSRTSWKIASSLKKLALVSFIKAPTVWLTVPETAESRPEMNQDEVASFGARGAVDVGMDAAEKPALDEFQLSIHGGLRNVHEIGRLFGGAAEEVTQL